MAAMSPKRAPDARRGAFRLDPLVRYGNATAKRCGATGSDFDLRKYFG